MTTTRRGFLSRLLGAAGALLGLPLAPKAASDLREGTAPICAPSYWVGPGCTYHASSSPVWDDPEVIKEYRVFWPEA